MQSILGEEAGYTPPVYKAPAKVWTQRISMEHCLFLRKWCSVS